MNRRSFFAALVAFAASLVYGSGRWVRAVRIPNHSGKMLLAKDRFYIWSSLPRSSPVGSVVREFRYSNCRVDRWFLTRLRNGDV